MSRSGPSCFCITYAIPAPTNAPSGPAYVLKTRNMSKREPPTNPTAGLEPISRQLMSTCESGKPKGHGSQTKESVDGGNLQETKRKGVLEAERDKDLEHKLHSA